ncbi:MAG: hypothetical protein ACR2NA_02850 [Solirubrobacterales bacterium]
MASNGHRRPPRPRLQIEGGAASPEETAAIAGAVEQFMAETAPRPDAGPSGPSRWQQAALLDGVLARQRRPDTWSAGWPPLDV